MDTGILNEVIAAEKEVQRCVEEEQERIRQWLDEVRREVADAVLREEKNDGAEREQALAAATMDAEARARVLRDDAAVLAARLERFDNARLDSIILKGMPRILLE